MTRKRTNFRAMNLDRFISYLQDKTIDYNKSDAVMEDGTTVIKVVPSHHRLKARSFNLDSREQLLNSKRSSSEIEHFVTIVDDRINNMSTKGVYHPRRLKPKWDNLTSNQEKIILFQKYMKSPTPSIGFIRLIEVNLPDKTLESIIIENPHFEQLIGVDNLFQKCVDKFRPYGNGRTYLKLKGLN